MKGYIGQSTHLVNRFGKKRIKRSAINIGKKLGITNPNKWQLNKLKRIANLDRA